MNILVKTAATVLMILFVNCSQALSFVSGKPPSLSELVESHKNIAIITVTSVKFSSEKSSSSGRPLYEHTASVECSLLGTKENLQIYSDYFQLEFNHRYLLMWNFVNSVGSGESFRKVIIEKKGFNVYEFYPDGKSVFGVDVIETKEIINSSQDSIKIVNNIEFYKGGDRYFPDPELVMMYDAMSKNYYLPWNFVEKRIFELISTKKKGAHLFNLSKEVDDAEKNKGVGAEFPAPCGTERTQSQSRVSLE